MCASGNFDVTVKCCNVRLCVYVISYSILCYMAHLGRRVNGSKGTFFSTTSGVTTINVNQSAFSNNQSIYNHNRSKISLPNGLLLIHNQSRRHIDHCQVGKSET